MGRAAVVSLHRLRAEAYGLLSDADPYEHLLKQAVHELGHNVMRGSTYVGDIDLKDAAFSDSFLDRPVPTGRSDGARPAE